MSNVLLLDIILDGRDINSNILAISFLFSEENKVYLLYNIKEEEMIRLFCSKIKNKNFIKIITYEEKKLFLLRMKILKYNTYCRNFGELDNPLTTIFLGNYFRNKSFEEICKFFEIEVYEENKIIEKLLSKEDVRKELKERIEGLSLLYYKLKRYCL